MEVAAVGAPLSPTKLDRKKQDRVRLLRKAFSIRKEFPETKTIIDSEGTLNKAYFSVKPAADERKWTDDDAQLLVAGIQKFGVGRFADIQREVLPNWSAKLLTVKTMRLLGTRDLKRYRGWKGTPELIAKEHQKNQRTGEENGTWHNGVIDETRPRTPKPKPATTDPDSQEDFQPTVRRA